MPSASLMPLPVPRGVSTFLSPLPFTEVKQVCSHPQSRGIAEDAGQHSKLWGPLEDEMLEHLFSFT